MSKDCYCPIARAHCASGIVEGQQAECEFWYTEEGDCLIRRVLEWFDLFLEGLHSFTLKWRGGG